MCLTIDNFYFQLRDITVAEFLVFVAHGHLYGNLKCTNKEEC